MRTAVVRAGKARGSIALGALGAIAAVAAAAGAWLTFVLFAPLSIKTPVELAVGPGEPTQKIAYRLEQEGVVRSRYALMLAARLGERDRMIRHGQHAFAGTMTPSQVVDELVRRPPQAGIVVTIPEGLTFAEIGALLEDAGVVNAEEYKAAACEPDLRERVDVPPEANCVEGYLFPDTYAFTPGTTAAQVVDRQLSRFEQVMARLLPLVTPDESNALVAVDPSPSGAESWVVHPSGAAMGKRLLHETVTLASIVEKETSLESERTLVSSVFHNRLNRGMRLQADPTAIYGVHASGEVWDGKRLHELLRKPNPYNTYTSDGLPPGPICNPGSGALAAVLAPEQTEFLYFVATGEGGHSFSATLAEHNKAVARLRARAGS